MALLVCGRRAPDFGNRSHGLLVLRGSVVLDRQPAGCTLRKPIKILREHIAIARPTRFWAATPSNPRRAVKEIPAAAAHCAGSIDTRHQVAEMPVLRRHVAPPKSQHSDGSGSGGIRPGYVRCFPCADQRQRATDRHLAVQLAGVLYCGHADARASRPLRIHGQIPEN
jgi:hypothetical protein